MESIYAIPYCILECPNLKLKRPSWVHMPSAMVVFAVVLASYFLVTGGRRMIAFISHLKHKTEITNTDRTENRKYRAKL